MKKVVFGLFVVAMFALASCGGSKNEQQALDSLNQSLDQAVQELNQQVDSMAAIADSTVIQQKTQ